jgi:putative aldouronate transport system permease protein
METKRLGLPQKYKLFLFLLPFLVLTTLFAYLPLAGWRYAFFNYRAGIPLKWADFVGFRWFLSILESPARRMEVVRVMKNTLGMSGLGILTSWLPVFFAIMLTEIKSVHYQKIVQTLTTVPNFISWVMVYSFAFMLFSVDAGLINRLLMDLGLIDKGINFLLSSDHIWLKMTAWGIWKGLG